MTKPVKLPSGTEVKDAGPCGTATATDAVEHGYQIFISADYGRLILVNGGFVPSMCAKELRDAHKLLYADQMISIIEDLSGCGLLSEIVYDQINEILDNARGLK